MMLTSQNNKENLKMRGRAERDRMTLYRTQSGIRAVPLSEKLAHWQGSIVGPPDSPYEGGIFYLYIHLPFDYPFDPPVVKFLTKIIHPNISRHGDIGLDILTWNYCSSLTIAPILVSIQSILCDPYTKVNMAECSSISKQCDKNESNDFTEDFQDFCKNFKFLDTSSCCHCNGFYGPNFNQPMCCSCHKFLLSGRKRKRLSFISNVSKQLRYAISSKQSLRNIEQPLRYHPQLKDLSKIFEEHITNHYNNETKRSGKGENEGQTSFSNNETIACDNTYRSDTKISVLPVEILLKIFSSLDDMTMLKVRKVCQQWKKVAESQQELWKAYTKKRWPLFQRKAGNTNWYKIYSKLQSSCFCRTCAIQMMLTSQNNKENLKMRGRAERDRMTLYRTQSGIRAVPLSEKLAHWQGSIVGPPDSPYEGGIFYLYIHLPFDYPFDPPVVKFLTKIIHPNISRHGDIGLDILTWNYCSSLTIAPILVSIQSILCDPYTKVCMEPELGALYDNARPRFDALARFWTKKYAMNESMHFDD